MDTTTTANVDKSLSSSSSSSLRFSEPAAAAAASDQQLFRRPAHELSKMIKEGRLSAVRLCELYIDRIKQVQPIVNGMCEERFEAALQEAGHIDELVTRYRTLASRQSSLESQQPSQQQPTSQQPPPALLLSSAELDMLGSPLLGVPVTVKECIAVDGMKHSCGLWYRRNTLAAQDAVVVKNAKRFGLIPICTTNVPEMTLFWADCRNKIYGSTCNPYNSARVPGASSGGEGALLGAGASIVGIGTDIGGSLRNPAHYSGIMSHKPSPFLVSSEGNYPTVKEARLRLFTMGPMCRYASDLRYLLKVLLSDEDNPKRDSYYIHQPLEIGELRRRVLEQLEQPVDLSKIKFFHGQFSEMNRWRALLEQREPRVQPEIMAAQRDVIDHFKTRFNCQVEQIDLEKYLAKTYKAWLGMMACGGTIDRDQVFEEREAEKIFGISNLRLEVLKLMLGLSRHTKESIGTIIFGLPIPKSRSRAYKMCEKYEQLVCDMKKELEATLGEFGCVVMPTLPTVAHKHNHALMRTNEARFPLLWNVAQFPVTHVTIRLDKAHGLPLGLTIASRPGNDALTIAVAEEIERTFGGWTPPSKF